MSTTIPVTGLPNIAFIGKAGAGKTTAAQLLMSTFGYGKFAFADPLKDIATQIWGESARTDRDKLQRLGVAVREIDSDAWANLLVRKVKALPPGVRVTVDDCRFPNEAQLLGEIGFVFVRIEADTMARVERLIAIDKLQDELQLVHESETALDDFVSDYTVFNQQDNRDGFYESIIGVLNREARRL